MSAPWWTSSEAQRRDLLARRGVNLAQLPVDPEGRLRALEFFRNCVFGSPESVPGAVASFSAPFRISDHLTGTLVRWQGTTGTATKAIEALVVTGPNLRTPASAFLLLTYEKARATDLVECTDFWPVERIVAAGYAAVAFRCQDVSPDEDQRDAQGRLTNPRTIATWAWGASRVLDALGSLSEIDQSRVAVIGHSRCGKTALWAAATDPRFVMAVSNNSGCTGAALARGTTGETIAQIQDRFPYWFASEYLAYADRVHELPVDQHQLLANLSPRWLYVTSATEDAWADPEGEFLSTLAAGDAFAHPIPWDVHLEPDHPVTTPSLGYHLRTGPHALTAWDWDQVIAFANPRFGPDTSPGKPGNVSA